MINLVSGCRNRLARHLSIITINWSIKEALYFIGQLGQSVETPKERSPVEGARGREQRSSLRSLVRRLSISSGIGRYAIGSFGQGGATGPSGGGGPVERFAGAEGTEANVNGCPGGSQPVAGPGTSGTVSASAARDGRGVASPRSSREQSPSKSSEGQDAPTHGGGGGGGAGSASSAGATGSGQDWRRLVGSIRRKVRRKTGQGSASISEALHETNRNQDDFLKATMRIFLVVSPPMGRVQVP